MSSTLMTRPKVGVDGQKYGLLGYGNEKLKDKNNIYRFYNLLFHFPDGDIKGTYSTLSTTPDGATVCLPPRP